MKVWSLNLVLCSYFSSVMLTTKASDREGEQPFVHKGRQLMSVSESRSDQPWDLDQNMIIRFQKILLGYADPASRGQKFNGTDVPPMCPTYFNKTESMRY